MGEYPTGSTGGRSRRPKCMQQRDGVHSLGAATMAAWRWRGSQSACSAYRVLMRDDLCQAASRLRHAHAHAHAHVMHVHVHVYASRQVVYPAHMHIRAHVHVACCMCMCTCASPSTFAITSG